MSDTNCIQKWRLYKLWCQAVDANDATMIRQYKAAHDNHVAVCPLCQERINNVRGIKEIKNELQR